MSEDKFTHIYRLPTSIQIRIGKWQQTFRGTSDLVLHKAIEVRNKKYKEHGFFAPRWHVQLFDSNDISITEHGRYIQTSMRSMIDRKIMYKRLYFATHPDGDAYKKLEQFKREWIHKHNRVAKKYNQIKKKNFLNFAREEAETMYPSIPPSEFDVALWNKLVISEFGPQKRYDNPFYVKKNRV